jgi:hypothetical protein
MIDYVATLRSATTVLPIATQMEEVYPAADHFITHYGFDAKPKIWNTEVVFGDRYVLTMQVEIAIDYSASRIVRVMGPPTFYLKELRTIEVLPDGRASTSTNDGKIFGASAWATLYAHDGDLASIGVRVNELPIPQFGVYMSQVRRDRVHISLVDK